MFLRRSREERRRKFIDSDVGERCCDVCLRWWSVAERRFYGRVSVSSISRILKQLRAFCRWAFGNARETHNPNQADKINSYESGNFHLAAFLRYLHSNLRLSFSLPPSIVQRASLYPRFSTGFEYHLNKYINLNKHCCFETPKKGARKNWQNQSLHEKAIERE